MYLLAIPKNGLVESLIKRVKLIAKPLLQQSSLSITCWGHAVLNVVDLIQIWPTAYHNYSHYN